MVINPNNLKLKKNVLKPCFSLFCVFHLSEELNFLRASHQDRIGTEAVHNLQVHKGKGSKNKMINLAEFSVRCLPTPPPSQKINDLPPHE